MVTFIKIISQETITYFSIIERKHYVRSPRLLKTTLFSFERCLVTHKKKICEEIESIEKFKNFRFPSLIDIHMSCVLCLGDIMQKKIAFLDLL